MQAQSDEGAERVTAMDGSGTGCDMPVIRFSISIVEKKCKKCHTNMRLIIKRKNGAESNDITNKYRF